MNPPVPTERPALENYISQQIASCICQLIGLEHIERDYLLLLEQKAELERRIEWLQSMERNQTP
jgi:hypothetical protein